MSFLLLPFSRNQKRGLHTNSKPVVSYMQEEREVVSYLQEEREGPSDLPPALTQEHGQRGLRLEDDRDRHTPNFSPKSALHHSAGLRFVLAS